MAEPQPLQIIKINQDNTLDFKEDLLRNILSRDHIKNRYISIVSVAGAFRQGKSFLLNFFLRFLQTKYVAKRNVHDWLTPEDGPISGFSCQSGSHRHTIGIWMWSEVFLIDFPNGDKVAIMLLDTQGTFDHESTYNDSATIFALSTLLSSVQIYNLIRNVKQDDLQHLQCFAGYGQLAEVEAAVKFQNLMFLVRDWSWPGEKPYGAEGGQALLEELMQGFTNEEISKQRDSLLEQFEQISCFLLPHPGQAVATDPEFNGNVAAVDNIFKKHVQDLAPLVLAPHNLVLKKINQQKVKAGDFIYFVKAYVETYKSGKLPKVGTVFTASAEAQHQVAALEAFNAYTRQMQNVCGPSSPALLNNSLSNHHSMSKHSAIHIYRSYKKIDDGSMKNKYLGKLEEKMEAAFSGMKNSNDFKLKNKLSEEQRIAKIKAEEMKRKKENLMYPTLDQLATPENIGTAAAVVGALGVGAFVLSRIFGGNKQNE